MLIVGENLKNLVSQYEMCDDEKAFDGNSLTLSLDRQLISIVPPDPSQELTYGHHIPATWLRRFSMEDSGYVLVGGGSILGCSHQEIRIPTGYFGFLQTKGSLARLFVTVNCGDGQVDAGYSGKVTFEMVNLAPFKVRLQPLQPVAQLFVFKTSTREAPPYRGRYQAAKEPTIQLPVDEIPKKSEAKTNRKKR